MSALLTAAGVFQEKSVMLGNVMPADGPAVPDGGGVGVNQAMQQAVQLLGTRNAQLATAISHHSTLLQQAHTTYAHAEKDLEKLATEITNPDPI